MAISTDLSADTFYVGADWPGIPMQLAPVGDLTGIPMEFRVYPVNAKATDTPIFTETTTGGGVVVTGADTDIATGLFYVKVAATHTTLLTAEVDEVTPYRWELWRTDSGNKNLLGRGTIPVTG